MDLKENKAIHAFSWNSGNCQISPVSGKSFILIVEDDFDEQKLKQDLKVLKEIYGKRLMNFEEESILTPCGQFLSILR